MTRVFSEILSKLHHEFSAQFESCEEMSHEMVRDSGVTISSVAEHLIRAGGKRLRPIVAFVVADIYGARKRATPLAVCVEILHGASILHDDIVDDGKMRRGVPTANILWGNRRSLLVGDFLLSQVFKILSDCGNLDMMRVMTNTTARIAASEIMQMEEAYNVDIMMEKYLQIANGKTAALFEASCVLPAMLFAENAKEIEIWRCFGENFGMCFQILDDLLDYVAKEEDMGKDVMRDVAEGKITLPAILLLRHNDQIAQNAINELMNQERKAENAAIILQKCEEYNIIQAAQKYMDGYVQKCIECLDAFIERSDNCDSAVKVLNLLKELVLSMPHRVTRSAT